MIRNELEEIENVSVVLIQSNKMMMYLLDQPRCGFKPVEAVVATTSDG